MSTIRRVVARARRHLIFVSCALGVAMTVQAEPVSAEGDASTPVPDPLTWGTVEPSAGRAAAPDSADVRRPVAKMVWKTVTSPSGRTFQVLEAATPEEIENAAREARTAATKSGDDSSAIVGVSAAPEGAGPAGSGGDIAMMGDLGRTTGRSSGGNPTALGQWMNQGGVPKITSFGVYGGYSSTAGFQLAIPTDATFAFRMGLTGFPGIGWLWTPGVELRFGQTPGAYNTDGVYGFSNLYVGETVSDDPVTKHWGVETGAGYRWILPDRRSVRWIAAIEIGGRWSPDSSAPKTPAVRAFWMIAAP